MSTGHTLPELKKTSSYLFFWKPGEYWHLAYSTLDTWCRGYRPRLLWTRSWRGGSWWGSSRSWRRSYRWPWRGSWESKRWLVCWGKNSRGITCGEEVVAFQMGIYPLGPRLRCNWGWPGCEGGEKVGSDLRTGVEVVGPGVGWLPVERPHPHPQPWEHHQGLEVGIKLQWWLSTGNWADGKGGARVFRCATIVSESGARLLCVW